MEEVEDETYSLDWPLGATGACPCERVEVLGRVGTSGPGRETGVDRNGETCSQGVESGDGRDSCYGNRHRGCGGAARAERYDSVGASDGSVFERAGLCGLRIRHLVKRTKNF